MLFALFCISILLGCAKTENNQINPASSDKQNLDSYRVNIGKTAFNATNDAERGKIVDVELILVNGVEQIVYKVNKEGRIENAPVSNVLVKDVPSTLSKEPKPDGEGVKIDSALERVASEFRNRLAYYDGQVLSLTLNNGHIVAEWNSQKCDFIQGEVTDLAMSINRGYSDDISAIDMKRTCNSNTKKFTISGAKFKQYKSGQINDPQFLKGIK